MAARLYMNVCTTGDVQLGYNPGTGGGQKTYRSLPPREQEPIVFFVDVHLNDGIEPSLIEFEKAVDQFFDKACPVRQNFLNEAKVSNGAVELLFHEGKPNTPEAVKEKLRVAMTLANM